MTNPYRRTYFAISPKGERHEVLTSTYPDCVAIAAFRLKEVAHGWRILDEGLWKREAHVEVTLSAASAEVAASHAGTRAFFEAIGYGAAEKRRSASSIKRFTRDSKLPDGRYRCIDDKPYRVVLGKA